MKKLLAKAMERKTRGVQIVDPLDWYYGDMVADESMLFHDYPQLAAQMLAHNQDEAQPDDEFELQMSDLTPFDNWVNSQG